jgi:hypothetical protein
MATCQNVPEAGRHLFAMQFPSELVEFPCGGFQAVRGRSVFLRSDDEHATGEPYRQYGVVLEADIDAKRSVIDGMTDVVHDFSVDADM